MTKAFSIIRREWTIILILVIAFIFRVWGLTTESLWLDELHNMNEASPYISWGAMFDYLKCCDQHPPLYFIVERLSFTIFGHTEFVARFISVLAGTASVWAMWFMGKEILNKNLGCLAAILTTINYYNISYSQEARGYIFAFLFAALSFVYFIKLIKSPVRKNIILYAVFSLLLLYSHYYSLFVVASQGALALLFIGLEKGAERSRLFKSFLFSGLIIIAGYLPWVPFVMKMSELKSFWISNISGDFLASYFYSYFGNADLLKPFLISLLLVYIVHVSLKKEAIRPNEIKSNPLQFSFIILLSWIFITYLIPFVRSVLVVPMLFPRYTIVVLPAILLALAYGIELLKTPVLKFVITGFIVLISLIDIVVVNHYYTSLSKTQFREMTKFVVKENDQNFPIINQVTSWHQEYYLTKFGSKAKMISGVKENLVDSILKKSSPEWDLDGFWIVGAHGDNMLNEAKRKDLDTSYMLLKQEMFRDAWAQLFINKKKLAGNNRVINYTDFAPGEGTVITDQKRIAIWGGAINTNPIPLEKGMYKLTISAMGTKAKDVFPHLNIYFNGTKIGDYFVTEEMQNTPFNIENTSDGNSVIKVEMDNDYSSSTDGDRNAFVQYILVEKLK